ncbi:MAG: hypothetical protein KA282_01060 [Clostridia bacterium]|nr:hypothetical protein [Clostridia bacterium]
MSEQKPLVANLTIDLRRNRFRIHQDTIHNLGDPAYIQFLINPEDGFIAILGSEKPLAGGTANKVTLYNASRSKSAEFYSSNLMNSIFKIFGSLDFRFSYRLTGEIDQVNRVAYYSMQTLQRVERRTLDDRQRI